MTKEYFLRIGSQPVPRRPLDMQWEIQRFLETACLAGFETQYKGEDGWFPATPDEVAQTLASYYPCLHDCLIKFASGKVLSSPMSRFRLAQGQDTERLLEGLGEGCC